MSKWGVLAVLGAAQFLMVLDQAVMNVAISQLVADFDTTVTTIQAVIALYALVMAGADAHRRQARRPLGPAARVSGSASSSTPRARP